MVSNVNSRGIPGRETAGGYLIHHGHSRQATLHTALWSITRGINPRNYRRTAMQVSSRAVGRPSIPYGML